MLNTLTSSTSNTIPTTNNNNTNYKEQIHSSYSNTSSLTCQPEATAKKSSRKLELEALTALVSEEPKAKRFSNLTQNELRLLWTHVCIFINAQLRANRSVLIPGLGHFFVNKEIEYTPGNATSFVPCYSWNKKKGSVTKTMSQKTAVTEALNFSVIAREGGFSRDRAETGFKDIMFFLVNILKRGEVPVQLCFPKIGCLTVGLKSIKFKFDKNFGQREQDTTLFTSTKDGKENSTVVEISSSDTEERAGESTLEQSSRKENNSLLSNNNNDTQDAFTTETTSTTENRQNQRQQLTEEQITGIWGLSMLDKHSNVNGILLPPIQAKPEGWSENHQQRPFNNTTPLPATSSRTSTPGSLTTEEENDFGFLFGLRSMKEYHTHGHSGNRLWSNSKCPLCLQSSGTVIDRSEACKKRDVEQDQLLLQLSLEADKEFVKKKREQEIEMFNQSAEIARYNRQKAIERENIRKSELVPKPMGDLLETRKQPKSRRALNNTNAAEVIKQIEKKKLTKQEEAWQQEAEDKIMNSQFVKQFKKYEKEKREEKLRKMQYHRQGLERQIKTNTEKTQEPEIEMVNAFAKDETPIFHQQRDRARKLYQEQLQILSQKREYESQVKEMQRETHIDRLAVFKSRLDQDIKNIKRAKYEARKNLESYWTSQIRYKQEHESAYS